MRSNFGQFAPLQILTNSFKRFRFSLTSGSSASSHSFCAAIHAASYDTLQHNGAYGECNGDRAGENRCFSLLSGFCIRILCLLEVVIVKRPKTNQAAWSKRLNAPKPVRKRKNRHRAR